MLKKEMICLSVATLVSASACGRFARRQTETAATTETAPTAVTVAELEINSTEANTGIGALAGGFRSQVVTINSGGEVPLRRVANIPETCVGYVTARPDYIVNYSNASRLLRVSVNSNEDTTLAIRDGQGNWHCNDDAGDSLNPAININSPTEGRYEIWVGNLRSTARVAGELHLDEHDRSNAPLEIEGVDAAAGTANLRGGFRTNTVAVRAGGNIAALGRPGLPEGCMGHVTHQPTYIVNYENPRQHLRLYVSSNEDSTLIVRDPAGNWHCDDDSGGYPNPMIDMPAPAAGRYEVWVGSYSSENTISGDLVATESNRTRPRTRRR